MEGIFSNHTFYWCGTSIYTTNVHLVKWNMDDIISSIHQSKGRLEQKTLTLEYCKITCAPLFLEWKWCGAPITVVISFITHESCTPFPIFNLSHEGSKPFAIRIFEFGELLTMTSPCANKSSLHLTVVSSILLTNMLCNSYSCKWYLGCIWLFEHGFEWDRIMWHYNHLNCRNLIIYLVYLRHDWKSHHIFEMICCRRDLMRGQGG